MIDKAIVASFCLVLIVTICVSFVGIIVDIAQKINFDNQCRNTLWQIDLKGGLDQIDKDELNSKLGQLGFANIKITCPVSIEYGLPINLNVTASRTTRKWTSLFGSSNEIILYSYNRCIISRRVHNGA